MEQTERNSNGTERNGINARALCWWLVGFAFAYGTDSKGFIGTDLWALTGGKERFGTGGIKEAEWVFDWAFAGEFSFPSSWFYKYSWWRCLFCCCCFGVAVC